MSKITGSFIILVFVIFLSSIVYIWQSDAEKKELEIQIAEQTAKIDVLKSQLEQKDTPADEIGGEVNGATTETGNILGVVTINSDVNAEAIIVCANETHTKLETCTDFIINPAETVYEYEFELPAGTYEVYSITPPSEKKIYYSEISNCDDKGDCASNLDQKRLIQVIQNETQSNIDIYL